MTTPPTDVELRAALALAARATPRPWIIRTAEGLGAFVEHPKQKGQAFGQEILGDDDYPTKDGDIAFIAAARAGWPAAAEALLATRAALRDILRNTRLDEKQDLYVPNNEITFSLALVRARNVLGEA